MLYCLAKKAGEHSLGAFGGGHLCHQSEKRPGVCNSTGLFHWRDSMKSNFSKVTGRPRKAPAHSPPCEIMGCSRAVFIAAVEDQEWIGFPKEVLLV